MEALHPAPVVRITSVSIERVLDDVYLDEDTGTFWAVAFDEEGNELSREPKE